MKAGGVGACGTPSPRVPMCGASGAPHVKVQARQHSLAAAKAALPMPHLFVRPSTAHRSLSVRALHPGEEYVGVQVVVPPVHRDTSLLHDFTINVPVRSWELRSSYTIAQVRAELLSNLHDVRLRADALPKSVYDPSDPANETAPSSVALVDCLRLAIQIRPAEVAIAKQLRADAKSSGAAQRLRSDEELLHFWTDEGGRTVQLIIMVRGCGCGL